MLPQLKTDTFPRWAVEATPTQCPSLKGFILWLYKAELMQIKFTLHCVFQWLKKTMLQLACKLCNVTDVLT